MSAAETHVAKAHPSVTSYVALRLSGEIDLGNSPDLQSALEAAIQQEGPILIDVHELTFIDSTGIHVLVEAAKALQNHGCLVIHGEQKQLSKILDLIGVDAMVKNLHRVHRGEEEKVPSKALL